MDSYNIILSYILSKLSDGYSLKLIRHSDEFNILCENNPITIYEAKNIENKLRKLDKLPRLIPYDIDGCCWMKPFGFPKDGDNIIMNNEYLGRARNIGIFIFHVVNEEKDDSQIDYMIENEIAVYDIKEVE